MGSDLTFLQSLSERELTELVVIPLLEKLGYKDIRYTHGILEHGKDVVCIREDALEGDVYIGFTIKAHPLRGSVSSRQSIREVMYQAEQALSEPFLSPLDGREVFLRQVYILTSHAIDEISVSSVRHQLADQSARIAFLDGSHLLRLLRENLPDLLSSVHDPTHVYLLGIRQRFLQLTTAVSLGSPRTFNLTDIYTGGKLAATTPAEAAYLSFADQDADPGGSPPLLVANQTPFAVVLADVGAGKTTLLKKLALDLILSETGDIAPTHNVVPVFVELASITKEALRSREAFHKWLGAAIGGSTRLPGFRVGQPTNNLLLLDGFDEAPFDHKSLAEYIYELVEQFPCGIFVTSRPSRIPQLKPPFSYYRLNPFSDDDIGAFLLKWFGNEARVREVVEHIHSDSTLLGFCRTPLLLTLFSVLTMSDTLDRLPTRRAEIYDSLTALLLGRWDSLRQVTNLFSPDLKSYCLEQLAHHLHERKRKVFERDDLVQLAARLLIEPEEAKEIPAYRFRTAEKAGLLFDELIFRSSLLRQHDDGRFYFTHLSFQEFFCARHLIRLGERKLIEQRLFDEWWKNVVVFYFGTTRSMDGIRIPAKRAGGKAHVLAEYLSEAEYTSAGQRDVVFRLIAGELMSTPQLPATVVSACRRLSPELLGAMERLLTETAERVWLGFFDLCLQLGSEGIRTASLHLDRLNDYPVASVSRVVVRSASAVSSEAGGEMFARALFILEKVALAHLRSAPRLQQNEIRRALARDLQEVNKRVSRETSLDAKKRSKYFVDIKSLQHRLG